MCLNVGYHMPNTKTQMQTTRNVMNSDATIALHLEQAEEIAGIGRWVYDVAARKFAFVSPGYARIYGMTPEDMLAQPLQDDHRFSDNLTFPEDVERVAKAYADCVAKGERYSIRYRMIQPDGAVRWLHEIGGAVYDYDEHGAVSTVVGTCQDITEQIEADEAHKRSENLLHSFLENAPFGIVVKDHQRRHRMINKAFADMLDIDATDWMGRTIEDIMPNDLGAMWRDTDLQVLETGEASVIDKQFMVGGVLRDILSIKFPVRNASGEITEIGLIEIDVSEQHRTRERMEDLHAAIDAMSEPVAVLDAEDRYVFANKAEHKFNGAVSETIKPGMLFEDHISAIAEHGLAPNAIGREEEWVAERMAKHHSADGPFELRRQDGRWVLVTEERLPSGGMVMLLTDITRQKDAQAALSKARDVAEQANFAKSEFLANMSHELRTPLNAIIGFSQTFMGEVFGPLGNAQYHEYANDIHDSGQHLLELINDILDLSAIEAGQLELFEAEVDLHRQSASMVRLIMPRARQGEIIIENNIVRSTPKLYGDERRIKQVLLNILTNAVKFTKPGGRVVIDTLVDGDELALSIRDSGIGMNAADLEKAQEPFGQVNRGYESKHEGTGLGIPLSNSLMELHGGTMVIESQPDVGTTVTIRFPAERMLK